MYSTDQLVYDVLCSLQADVGVINLITRFKFPSTCVLKIYHPFLTEFSLTLCSKFVVTEPLLNLTCALVCVTS
jgi:hypothetical protein